MSHIRAMRYFVTHHRWTGLLAPLRRYSQRPKLSKDFKCVLLNRAHLRVEGTEALQFLQGLVTNDVECLTRDCNVLYSMVLNVKGRVLTDLLIYNEHPEIYTNSFILQFDPSQRMDIFKLFKRYKLRRKITIKDITDDISSYVSLGCCDEQPDNISETSRLYRDPRLKQLGWRILSDRDQAIPGKTDEEPIYKEWRYILGISEGAEENIPEKALPLESNLALLNGVSFSKGCYIGQELTARTHHTGVIRKRIMPVTLNHDQSEGSLIGCTVNNSEGKSVGTVKGNIGNHALALVRLSHVIKAHSSYIDYNSELLACSVSTPPWWPVSVLENAV